MMAYTYRRIIPVMILASLLLAGCSSPDEDLFDERLAWNHLLEICSFGPRVPGTGGHRACLEYIDGTLRAHGAEVIHQSFRHDLGYGEVTLTNLIASLPGKTDDRICLAAHWDTRPVADRDPDPKNRATPITGANDGASGVAVLLEIARIVAAKPAALGVDFIFFDGEDSGESGTPTTFCIGSQYFASRAAHYRPRFGMVLDMIGDRDLGIKKEGYSLRYCPDIVEKVWTTAARLGISSFIDRRGYTIYDDHVPLLQAGMRFIDIIDFDYPYWHTLDDTPEHCSPESLEKVGRVVCTLIYRER
jgi:hypothetical protein